MKEPKTEFGRELRYLRLHGKIKYSQQKLAKLAGITASYLSQLESTNTIPRADVIRRLSGHLGIPSNHLFSKCGMIEMDLASTLKNKKDEVKRTFPNISEEQLEELANYLTFLDFKKSALV